MRLLASKIAQGFILSLQKISNISLSQAHNIAIVIQAFAAIVGAAVALVWFFMQGNIEPHVNITHDLKYLKLNDQWGYLRTTINLENAGKVPARIAEGKAFIQVLLPLEEPFKSDLNSNYSIIEKSGHNVKWNTFGEPYILKIRKYMAPVYGYGTFLDILTSRTIYVIRDICHADQE